MAGGGGSITDSDGGIVTSLSAGGLSAGAEKGILVLLSNLCESIDPVAVPGVLRQLAEKFAMLADLVGKHGLAGAIAGPQETSAFPPGKVLHHAPNVEDVIGTRSSLPPGSVAAEQMRQGSRRSSLTHQPSTGGASAFSAPVQGRRSSIAARATPAIAAEVSAPTTSV